MQAQLTPPAHASEATHGSDKDAFFKEVTDFLQAHPTINQESTLFQRATGNPNLGRTMRSRAKRDRLNMVKVRAWIAEERAKIGLPEPSAPEVDEDGDVMP